MLAVLGQISNARLHRIAGGANVDALAMHFDHAAIARVRPEDCARHFGAPCPHKTCKPQNLTALHREADILNVAPAI